MNTRIADSPYLKGTSSAIKQAFRKYQCGLIRHTDRPILFKHLLGERTVVYGLQGLQRCTSDGRAVATELRHHELGPQVNLESLKLTIDVHTDHFDPQIPLVLQKFSFSLDMYFINFSAVKFSAIRSRAPDRRLAPAM